MNVRLWQVILFAVCLAVVQIFVVPLEVLHGYTQLDLCTHFLGGALCATLGIWVLGGKRIRPIFGKPSLFTLILLNSFVFALGGSFLWENFELLFVGYAPNSLRWLHLYSGSVSDVLSDVGMGLMGGSYIALLDFLKRKTRK